MGLWNTGIQRVPPEQITTYKDLVGPIPQVVGFGSQQPVVYHLCLHLGPLLFWSCL